MEDNTNITAILRTIGFTEGESKVYIALLGLGTSTTGAIVDKANVSASKVYNILDRLVEKGLVSTVTNQKKKQFRAADPSRLVEYLGAEQTRIEAQKKELATMLPQFEAIQGKTEKLPIVEVIGGKRGYDSFYREMIRDTPQGGRNRIIVSTMLSFLMQDMWYEYTVLTSQKNITVTSIYNEVTWFDKDPKVHRREERKNYYPLLIKTKAELPSISIMGTKTLLSSFDEENQLFSLIIRNELLTNEFIRLYDTFASTAVVPEGFKKLN